MSQRKGVYEDCRVTVAVRVRPLSRLEEREQAFRVVSVKENRSVLLFESLLYKNKLPVASVDEETNVYHESKFNSSEEEQPSHIFTYDHVYEMNAMQETVYNDLGRPLLEHCIRGFNTCLFAYGQTGSGKTYSMMGADGGRDTAHEPGIIPRLCAELFDQLALSQRLQKASLQAQRSAIGGDSDVKTALADSNQFHSCHTTVSVNTKTNNELPEHTLPERSFHVRVNFLEIYRERVHCLVSPSTTSLRVRQHPVLGVYVEGLTDVTVHNTSELLCVIREGNENRHISSTRMNEVSSRAHSIFTLHVMQKRNALNSDGSAASMEICSKISLVDLAGSERVRESHINDNALKETAVINKSLTTLGKVINALAEMNSNEEKTAARRHVPYRDSVLTFLLKDSLGGNSKTSMLSTISPSSLCFDETLSTLRYADRAKAIVSRAYVNESASDKRIRELEQEVARLRERIAELLEVNTNQKLTVKGKQVEISNSTIEKLQTITNTKVDRETSNMYSADKVNIVNNNANDDIKKTQIELSGTSSLTSLELEESTSSLELYDESFICSEWHNDTNNDKLLENEKRHVNLDTITNTNIQHKKTPLEWETSMHHVRSNDDSSINCNTKYASITIKEVKSLESRLLKSEQVMDYLKSLTPMTFIEEEWKENIEQEEEEDWLGTLEIDDTKKINNSLESIHTSHEELHYNYNHSTNKEQDNITTTTNMTMEATVPVSENLVSTFNNVDINTDNNNNDGSVTFGYDFNEKRAMSFTPNLQDGRFCGRHNIIFVGHSGSGKYTIRHLLQESTRTTNSLWSRWTGGNALPRVSPTHGISTSSVTLKSSISTMRLMLYELSGAVQYLPLMSFLPVRRSTFVICFSLTHNPSLETVRRWLEAIMCQMERGCETDVILLATHADQCNLSTAALFECLCEVQKEICTFVQLIQPDTLLQPRIVHFIVVDNTKRCVYAPSFRRVTNFHELLEFLSDHAYTKCCNDSTFKNGMIPIQYLALARQIKVLQTTDVLFIPFCEYKHICQLILENMKKTSIHQEEKEQEYNQHEKARNRNQVCNFFSEMECCTELLSDWGLLSLLHPVKHVFHMLLCKLSSSSPELTTVVQEKELCYEQEPVIINVQAFLQIVTILLNLAVRQGEELQVIAEHKNRANTEESLLDKLVGVFSSSSSSGSTVISSVNLQHKANLPQGNAQLNNNTINFDFDLDYITTTERATNSSKNCNSSSSVSCKECSSLSESFDKLQKFSGEDIVNCDIDDLMRHGIFTSRVIKLLLQHVHMHKERIVNNNEVETVIVLLKECLLCFSSTCILHSDEMHVLSDNKTGSYKVKQILNSLNYTSSQHPKLKEREEQEKANIVAQVKFIGNTEQCILVPLLFSVFAPLSVTLHFPRYLSGPFYRINFNITPVHFFASLLCCLCNNADSEVERVYLGPVLRWCTCSNTTCHECQEFVRGVNAKESNYQHSKREKCHHSTNVNNAFWKDAAWLVGKKTCGRILIRLTHHSLLLACHFPQLHHLCNDQLINVPNSTSYCFANSMKSNSISDESREECNTKHEDVVKSCSTLLDSVMRTIDNLVAQYSGVQCTKYVLCHRTYKKNDEECPMLDFEHVRVTQEKEVFNKTQTSFQHSQWNSDIKDMQESSEYKQLDGHMSSLLKIIQCINNAAQSAQCTLYIPVLRLCAAPIDFMSLLQLLDEDVTLPFRTREMLRAAVSLWNKSCSDVCISDTVVDEIECCHSSCTKCRMQWLAADTLLNVLASLSK